VVTNEKYTLAIETSSRAGSAAIGRGADLLATVDFTAGARHGVELLPSVDKLLKQVDAKPQQIGVICVSAGPGSFTGLRVGFTFARCLSQVVGARLVAVPSARVIVENLCSMLLNEAGPIDIAPILDAKRKQVYTAGFRWDGHTLTQVLQECVLTPEELLSKLNRPLWITGEGVDYHHDEFANRENVIFTDRQYWQCRAECVFKLGIEMAEAGRFTPYNKLSPIYVRLPEAEEKWQITHAG
jgi:tRNA threonylcarbamoyladenosine biosynthesis protein TsaB